MASNLPSVDELAARVAELEAERALMLRMARTDELTGLVNRAAFSAATGERLDTLRRSGEALALLVVNIDSFRHPWGRFAETRL